MTALEGLVTHRALLMDAIDAGERVDDLVVLDADFDDPDLALVTLAARKLGLNLEDFIAVAVELYLGEVS